MARSIVHTNDVCGGEPRIDGSRLTCGNVVGMFAIGEMGLGYFLETYPYLTEDDVRACAEYCAARRCVEDNPRRFCQGCSLESARVELESTARREHGMPGPVDDPHDEEEVEPPDDMWLLAAEMLDRLD